MPSHELLQGEELREDHLREVLNLHLQLVLVEPVGLPLFNRPESRVEELHLEALSLRQRWQGRPVLAVLDQVELRFCLLFLSFPTASAG